MQKKDNKFTEQDLHFYLIDLLASEYGWTIEYIQNLTLTEIVGLANAIMERKKISDVLTQINIAKAFSGKISPNWGSLKDPNKVKEDEFKNLEKLKKLLEKIEGKNKGKKK